jgi:hypothetical protein
MQTEEMVAALLRILHSGTQDGRLLSTNIGMFQKVLIRAGRFTTQFVRLDFDTRPVLGAAATLTIPRKGHLVSRLYLVTTLPDIATPQKAARSYCDASGLRFIGPTFGWTNSVGHALLTEASIDIGGSRCDRLDGRLLEVLDEFNTPLEKVTAMNSLLPRKDNGFRPGVFGLEDGGTVAVTPLPFWFSSGDPGAYLPIDAIQADTVVLRVGWQPATSIYVSDTTQTPTTPSANLNGDAYVPLQDARFYAEKGMGRAMIPGIQMPSVFPLGDTYVLAEYIYLDRPEANRFRISDIRYPILQHYPFDPTDTQSASVRQIPLKIPNPTRSLFFYLQRFEAARYNAPFLATRDLSGAGTSTPWWPDASGLNVYSFGDLQAGFSTRESEPIRALNLMYEGNLTRYATDAPSLFRSLFPSFEMRKSPWVNRYMYTLPFAFEPGLIPPSLPSGEANLDKFLNIELALAMHPNRGSINPNDVPRFIVYIWAETYNILRVYGGRAGLLFGY